jgi:prephenate dehydrogenase
MTQATTDTPFRQVAVVGVGLLGASLGLALKRRGLAQHIIGVGRVGSPALRIALERQAIDAGATDLLTAVADCDLVVLCTPVRQVLAQLRVIAGALAPGALVTDVGSTKRVIVEQAREVMPAQAVFVGAHPMAGSEKRGPEHARAELFDDALCLICPDTHTPGAAVARIEALWRGVGMRTHCMPAGLHDRWVALVSHLPHAVATSLVLAAQAQPEALRAAAGGFVDTTRIAAGDIDMWLDILLTNRDEVGAAIGELQAHLGRLRAALADSDEGALRTHLAQAKAARDAFMKARQA